MLDGAAGRRGGHPGFLYPVPPPRPCFPPGLWTPSYVFRSPALGARPLKLRQVASGDGVCFCPLQEVTETFKSRISKLETLQQVTHLEVPGTVWDRPQELTFWFASLLLALAAVLLVLVSAVCACPLPLENSRLCACAGLLLLGLGALAWQKRHAIPSVDWQAWVPARWRLGSKDSRPLSDGP